MSSLISRRSSYTSPVSVKDSLTARAVLVVNAATPIAVRMAGVCLDTTREALPKPLVRIDELIL